MLLAGKMNLPICDVDYSECMGKHESNIDVISHKCKLKRVPMTCAHYCFKKKTPFKPETFRKESGENPTILTS